MVFEITLFLARPTSSRDFHLPDPQLLLFSSVNLPYRRPTFVDNILAEISKSISDGLADIFDGRLADIIYIFTGFYDY